jgi:hypothetical protein
MCLFACCDGSSPVISIPKHKSINGCPKNADRRPNIRGGINKGWIDAHAHDVAPQRNSPSQFRGLRRVIPQPSHGQQRPYCVAGHVRFELRNVVANYPFENSRRFAGKPPNSGQGDHSRLSCNAGDTQLGPAASIPRPRAHHWSVCAGLSAQRERVW